MKVAVLVDGSDGDAVERYARSAEGGRQVLPPGGGTTRTRVPAARARPDKMVSRPRKPLRFDDPGHAKQYVYESKEEAKDVFKRGSLK